MDGIIGRGNISRWMTRSDAGPGHWPLMLRYLSGPETLARETASRRNQRVAIREPAPLVHHTLWQHVQEVPVYKALHEEMREPRWRPASRSRSAHSWTVLPWSEHLSSPRLCFFICKAMSCSSHLLLGWPHFRLSQEGTPGALSTSSEYS